MSRVYLAYCDNNVFKAKSLREVLQKALQECRSSITVYRAFQVAVLEPDEARELLEARASGTALEQPGSTVGKLAVVFDQMFKGFAEILERELKDLPIEFHEILGRGIDKAIKVDERLFQQPAHDDYDVLKLLEALAAEGKTVLFFTGDKRLASQARMVNGVRVAYLPPSEVAGKELAIKIMLERIRRVAKELGNI